MVKISTYFLQEHTHFICDFCILFYLGRNNISNSTVKQMLAPNALHLTAGFFLQYIFAQSGNNSVKPGGAFSSFPLQCLSCNTVLQRDILSPLRRLLEEKDFYLSREVNSTSRLYPKWHLHLVPELSFHHSLSLFWLPPPHSSNSSLSHLRGAHIAPRHTLQLHPLTACLQGKNHKQVFGKQMLHKNMLHPCRACHLLPIKPKHAICFKGF